MDTRIKSVSFLILVLVASLCTSLLPLSEARPLSIYSPSKDGAIREVNGVFRTLKSSGPSPGIGHKLNKLQNLGGMKDSGPTPGNSVPYVHSKLHIQNGNLGTHGKWSKVLNLSLVHVLDIMTGKLQFLSFIVIIVWCSSWLNIQHAIARPLNTLLLHGDADQEPRRTTLELSHTVLRSFSVGDKEKDIVIDNSGPSPKGPGHDEALPFFYSQPNN
ncbi:unnamed protein product [Sphenostylis stenocarpa]|uniref:Transmembrane protein n=1 Tax=Sphenostylis stenocarpa TaxID=92480 RepID=A0AA86W3K1_9FABA|nr:unnamed protein product [Sphenostylis stenocarpa]